MERETRLPKRVAEIDVPELALRLLFGVALLFDGIHSLRSNERAEQLMETAESLFGEGADTYLIAGLLGLAELVLALGLLVSVARRAWLSSR